MWKIASFACVVFFISAKGKTIKEIDSRDVIDRIHDAKKQITDNLIEVHIKALDFSDQANNDFMGYIEILNYGINKSIEKIHNEINEIFNTSSNPKEECNVLAELYEVAAIVKENIRDCVPYTITNAVQKLSNAFSYSKNANKNLDHQKLLASICRDIDCKEILLETYLIRNRAIANITAEYEAFVDTIGNTNLLDKCINEDRTGYNKLLYFLSNFVSRTKACVASSH